MHMSLVNQIHIETYENGICSPKQLCEFTLGKSKLFSSFNLDFGTTRFSCCLSSIDSDPRKTLIERFISGKSSDIFDVIIGFYSKQLEHMSSRRQ